MCEKEMVDRLLDRYDCTREEVISILKKVEIHSPWSAEEYFEGCCRIKEVITGRKDNLQQHIMMLMSLSFFGVQAEKAGNAVAQALLEFE